MATTGSASAEPSAGDWAKLRNCESGGNYAINTGNGYYGAYQFDQSTWRSVGGSGLPSDASPATQDALAYKLWQQRGWSPWACASIVGLPEGGSGGPAVAAPVAPVVKKPAVSFDAARVSGNARSLTVNGWAVDGKSTAASIKVQVTVDGKVTTVAANRARPDVNRVRKISGQHGFAVTLPISAGSHKVCVTAVGTSGNTSAGCRTVVVPQQPTAHLDAVQVVHGRVIVKGWAYDPNAAGQSTKVAVVLNGQLHIAVANQSSGDVNRVNGINGRHRFTASLPLRFGSNKVCVTAWGTSSARTLSLGLRGHEPGQAGRIDRQGHRHRPYRPRGRLGLRPERQVDLGPGGHRRQRCTPGVQHQRAAGRRQPAVRSDRQAQLQRPGAVAQGQQQGLPDRDGQCRDPRCGPGLPDRQGLSSSRFAPSRRGVGANRMQAPPTTSVTGSSRPPPEDETPVAGVAAFRPRRTLAGHERGPCSPIGRGNRLKIGSVRVRVPPGALTCSDRNSGPRDRGYCTLTARYLSNHLR